jgi:hypothetical protein
MTPQAFILRMKALYGLTSILYVCQRLCGCMATAQHYYSWRGNYRICLYIFFQIKMNFHFDSMGSISLKITILILGAWVVFQSDHEELLAVILVTPILNLQGRRYTLQYIP